MASVKKTAGKGAKGKKTLPVRKPVAKAPVSKKPAPKPVQKAKQVAKAVAKAVKAPAKAAPAKAAPAKAAPAPAKADAGRLKELAERQKAAERAAAEAARDRARLEKELDQQRQLLAKEHEKLLAAQKQIADAREAARKAEADKKAYEKEVERQRKEAEKRAEQERKAAEKAEAQRLKEEQRAADAAAKAAAKKKPIGTTSITASPIFRPLADQRVELAPLPPAAKPGHVDHQMLSAIEYGLFAAVNKTFGFAGQSVVKNASLRILEYGYKRGWLPPKSKEPVRALNEFFGRLETMGYAEKIHVAKRGDGYVLEVSGLADFEAVHELRSMHYPLLPVFLGAMLEAIVDQYFQLKTTTEPLEWAESRRGFNLPFALVERAVAPEVSRLPAMSRMDDFEE